MIHYLSTNKKLLWSGTNSLIWSVEDALPIQRAKNQSVKSVAVEDGTIDLFVAWSFIYGYRVSPSKITMTAFPLLLARRNGVDLYLFSISTVAP